MYDLPIMAYWAIAGLIVGLGGFFVSTRSTKLGILTHVTLGILGGVLAGFLGREVLSIGIGNQLLPSLAMAAGGAAILLVIYGLTTSK